ncbi:MAG TPA: Dabb family protein [Actinomycetota bacterium]|nr:Dabb family protein [Actinomycetota bacterium]HNL50694.1 Dabb family protein [Actinomycetota bacterium]HNO14911.1 Dabb family protein [Actinomycetota bacterium]HUM85974.1 Dabb family protein [Actinomycetota bacterium]
MITHIVMMKLHDSDDRVEAATRLRDMEGRIPELLSLEVLIDDLGRPGAYDLVLRSTHADEAGLLAYVEHPVHQELLVWLRPRLADRAVVDAR